MKPPNKRYARRRVQTTLKAWAPIKVTAGRPFPIPNSSVKRVSNPIEVKAMANQTVLSPPNIPLVSFTRPGSRRKEKIKEAIRKPRTNFGNRSHITLTVGFSLVGVFFFKVHQIDIKKKQTKKNKI